MRFQNRSPDPLVSTPIQLCLASTVPDLGQNLSSPSTQCNSNSTFGVGGVSESDGEVRVLRIGVVEKKGITGSLPNLKSK